MTVTEILILVACLIILLTRVSPVVMGRTVILILVAFFCVFHHVADVCQSCCLLTFACMFIAFQGTPLVGKPSLFF